MGSERWQQVTEIFHAALASDPARRDAFLADACGGDAGLRAEVDALVAAHREAGPFGETPLFVPALSLDPGSSMGSYRIEELLGAGGMGEVYRARDGTLERDVAIKVLPRHVASNPERIARLLREARLLAALNHPNIAAIYGVVEADAHRGLVLEFVDGPTLADRLAAGPLSLDDALRIAHQIADALAAAHEQGIVHRDLKPANIKITSSGVVKVLDFGLAKDVAGDARHLSHSTAIAEARTHQGVLLGTSAYMSPEQAEGKPVDARSDVFALGVLLYEMLCGRRPFRGDTTLSTLASILQAAPDPPRHLRGEIPETVERIVLRCLEKKPEARYPSMQDVLRELAPYQVAKTTRFVLGRPAVVAIVLTILIGASGLGIRSYLNASRVRWVETVAVPELARSIAASRRFSALKLYREAEGYAPASRALQAFAEGLRAP